MEDGVDIVYVGRQVIAECFDIAFFIEVDDEGLIGWPLRLLRW